MQKMRVMRAAGFLMITTVVARVLGMVREVLLLNLFGRNSITDAYNAAFTIPDFLYTLLIGGALASAFTPVFSSYQAKDQYDDAWRVSDILTSWCLVLFSAAIVFAYCFTPQLIGILVPGFDEPTAALTVTLTRIMLIQPLFMALAGIAISILHVHQNFSTPAIGSLLYNIVIILCGVLLVRPFEALWPGYGVAGFSAGVVVASIIYFVVQLPALKRVDFRYRFTLDTRHPGFRKLLRLLVPVLLGLSVQQINLLVNQMLASNLDAGAIAALKMAQHFMQLPIGVFASSIAVVIFPTMTQQAALNDMVEYKKSLSLGIRCVAFTCLPSAVGIIVLREPIIRVMFEFSGNFAAEDTLIVGQALLFYCLGLVFYGIVQVLLRSFYALQNTIVPVAVSAVTLVVNLAFSYLLLRPMAHMGLALAFSLAGLVQCSLLFLILRRKIGPMDLRHILNSFLKTALVCVVMGLAAWAVAQGCAALLDVSGSKLAQIVQLVAAMVVAIVVFFGVASLLRMEEAKIVINMLQNRRRRKQSTQVE